MRELPVRVTGSSLSWARDLGIVAGVSAGLAPVWIFGPSAIVASAIVAGGVTGTAIGLGIPVLLDRVRGRVSLPALMSLGIGIGALWGAAIGALTASVEATILGPGATIAAASAFGAVQFGLYWLPYTIQTVTRGRTWPIVAATCALAPLTGAMIFSWFL